MRILYLHNYYLHRGGEDVSFDTDLTMLRHHGHSVMPYTKRNEDLSGSRLRMAADSIWNRQSYREVSELIERHRPDVMHCNNLFPRISTSVYHAAKRRGVPIVQALRNYRSFCSNSFFYRQGDVCTKCWKQPAALHGIRHACYRDSHLASTVVAGVQLSDKLLRHRRRYVSAYCTPTDFSRSMHVKAGYPADKVFTRTNFLLPDPGFSRTHGNYALYVGRLSEEKGVDLIIQAWREHGIQTPLRIVGGGPLEASLRRAASDLPQVEFFGQLDTTATQAQIKMARVLVMSSRWYETFGRTIAEAFACGVPVIASKLGAMAELVTDQVTGYHFAAGDAGDLAACVRRFVSRSEEEETAMRRAAREAFKDRFNVSISYRQLMRIYDRVLGSDAGRLVG